MSNHLIDETSPYLLQHANNPVDWHPWGKAALHKARDADKPILLSIGYSACHWCHVMERESFCDAATAARMNELFVCIKVDREERPDLDKIYQTAHQMLTQRPGGWPLTAALTPNGHAPFFAGTYFPPSPRHGLPGFVDALEQVARHYYQYRERMDGHHASFEAAMAQTNPQPRADDSPLPPAAAAVLAKSTAALRSQFDAEHGGFGTAPKFPHPTQLDLLLRHSYRDDAPDAARMLQQSLRKMAHGGLFDQIGGGFYRYSVDRRWEIPHFEKMLYDNAQLLALYSDAWQHTSEPLYRAVVEQTAAWTMREMQLQLGGYASTIDADSEGVEGKYYVWSETDLRAMLGADEYHALERHYGLAGEPNFDGQWHFNVNLADGEAGGSGRRLAQPAAARFLHSAREKLLVERNRRVRPALDDKILAAWNGLMIKGMARAAKAFGRDDFAVSARRALDFIRDAMWQNGRLLSVSCNHHAHLNGYLDDYAFLAEGIVELLQTTWRSADLTFATDICDAMLWHFEDTEAGGFFFTSHDHEKLLHRPKTGPDDAIPSGNGAAARALFKLGHLLGNSRYLDSAEKTLALFADALDKTPSIHGSLTAALQARDLANKTIIIRGQAEEIRRWQLVCQRPYHPETITFAIPAAATHLPAALGLRKPQNKTIAYICHGLHCSAPMDSLDALEDAIEATFTPRQHTDDIT